MTRASRLWPVAATIGRVLGRGVSVFFATMSSLDGGGNPVPPVTPTRRPDDYRP